MYSGPVLSKYYCTISLAFVGVPDQKEEHKKVTQTATKLIIIYGLDLETETKKRSLKTKIQIEILCQCLNKTRNFKAEMNSYICLLGLLSK